MSEEIHQPWERQDGEPNRWFQRFESFRLMGVGRSLLGAVNREREEKGRPKQRKVPGAWNEACVFWHWRDRAFAWDQYLIDQKEAAIEAKWKDEIMGKTEVLGRISQIGRVSIYDICEFGIDGHITGFKEGALEKFGHLIKRITSSKGKTISIGVELHDAKSATEWIGKYLGLVNEKSTRMNVDLSNLSDNQLQRLAAGEDLIHVLATPG